MPLLAVLGALALVAAIEVRGDANCRRTLASWAENEGYELLDARRRWIGFGFLFRGRQQRVYKIEVRHGRETETGLARVGGWFLGSLSDTVVVKWDW